MDKARQASAQKPLDSLRCLVCGMPDSKPVEDTLVALGAKVVSQHHRSQIPPDVVISDRAGARRLQNVLGWHQAIPVVTSEWAAVCKRTLQRVPYSEYALPALKDCSVSFTNLDRRDREALKSRVEDLGGTVCPDMSKSCTHLVVGNENKTSMKRQAAYEWLIPVVSLSWLTETLEKRSVIPIASYRLQNSTDAANTSCTVATDCSNPSARQESLKGGANATSLAAASVPEAAMAPLKQQNCAQAEPDGGAADPRYPLPQTQAGVLEHLQFYVSDMSSEEHAECSGIIKHLRGSKRTTLGAYVTHIIVDEHACQSQERRVILEFLEQTANVCTVVHPSWLRACAQASTLLDPKPFCVDTGRWNIDSGATQGLGQAGTVMSGCMLCLDALQEDADRRQAREYIRTLGGQVITAESSKLVKNWDKVFAVCPDSFPPSTVQELKRRNPCFARVDPGNMVNMFWVKQCRVAKQLYEAKKTFLFHPIPHKLPIAGFTNVCILITGFGDGVRLAIVHTMKALGGTCLETVATDQWSHVTHLVCDDSEGTKEGVKYNMCRRKKIPIVGLKWLGACVTSGKVQPHDGYAIKPKAGACVRTQPIPEKVEPSQRIFAGTQGGFGMLGADKPLQRRGVSRTQGGAANLKSNQVLQNNNSFPGGSMKRGDSLLLELSQGLSAPAAPSGPSSTGPHNFSNLRSQVPSAMKDAAPSNLPPIAVQSGAEKENPASVDMKLPHGGSAHAASVLHRIEQKYLTADDCARPTSAKRKSENAACNSGANKRACIHGALHSCSRCTLEKTQSAPARRASGFQERSAIALSEVVPGLFPGNVENLTQPLQLTQCSDPLPYTGAASTDKQHLSKAARIRKQKAPHNCATQVATDEDMNMWSSERRGAEIQATQVSFSQKVEFLATERY